MIVITPSEDLWCQAYLISDSSPLARSSGVDWGLQRGGREESGASRHPPRRATSIFSEGVRDRKTELERRGKGPLLEKHKLLRVLNRRGK